MKKYESTSIYNAMITDDGDNRLFDDNLESYVEAIADGIAKTLNEI